ncbi:Tryptophan synthase beta subunit-like PLP-dependent enzymes superfamily [Kalmanozyma brasiliensis GHG001]|nr:Tryptophan synthase beta subunit-like PLP-dependent enzymes superfamily [Kalmanozyma brasiliensis GHG001]EST05724.2 Tryptophan synthase beta subunit-like PLP-dependent enzymes superfamily [Kalmanozyma brasiliensis GHG001]
MTATNMVTFSDIQEAHARVSPYTHYTPVLTNQAIDSLATEALFGTSDHASTSSTPRVRLAFKAEHLQRVGAFKYRGATNSVLVHLAAAKAEHDASPTFRGAFSPDKLVVVTHSSGNHAAALACAAKTAGCIAAVVMPENAPKPKKEAVAGYGARITFCKPTLEARESTAKAVMEEYEDKGYTVRFVHPYDEPLVIAGQGTMALELLDQVPQLEVRAACSHAAEASAPSKRPLHGSKNVAPEGPKAEAAWHRRDASEPVLDIVIAPVGGGGMLSGVSTAVKGADSCIVVLGAEPDLVNDAFHSYQTGSVQLPPQPPKTICDGLLTSLSPLTLEHIHKNVDGIVTAREENVLKALQLHWTRQKQFVEPSAAVGLATVLQGFNEAAQQSGHATTDASDRSRWGLKEWAHHIVQQKTQAGIQDPDIRIGIIWSGGNVEVAKVVAKFEEYGL